MSHQVWRINAGKGEALSRQEEVALIGACLRIATPWGRGIESSCQGAGAVPEGAGPCVATWGGAWWGGAVQWSPAQ